MCVTPLRSEEEVQRWLGAAASSPAQGCSTLGALVGGAGVALPLCLEQRVGDAAGGGILGDGAGDDGGRQKAGAGGDGEPALAGMLQASGPHGREHSVDWVAARVGAVEAQPDVRESPQYSALSDTETPVELHQGQGTSMCLLVAHCLSTRAAQRGTYVDYESEWNVEKI